VSLASEPSFAPIHARVTDAFAAQDAEVKARLDWLVKVGGKCHGCGATVADAQLEKHPGVCSLCFRKKHLPPLQPPVVDTSAPTKENPMPCSVCGKPGHNARGCATRVDPKKTPPTAEQPRSAKAIVASLRRPPPSSPARPALANKVLQALLDDRAAALEVINQVDAELVRRRDEISKALSQLTKGAA
jgi:hypothetical protein